MSAADDNHLVFSGGGSTLVATDAMLVDVESLRIIHFAVGGIVSRLHVAAGLGPSVEELERATVAAREAQERAGSLESALNTAMEQYADAEARARQFVTNGAAVAGFLGGALFGTWLKVAFGPIGAPAVLLAFPWLVRAMTDSGEGIGPDDVVMPDEINRLLANPLTVEALRVAVGSADEAIYGFGGVPALNQAILAAAGITGVQSSAILVATWGATAGLFRETPVDVTRTRTSPADVAPGFEGQLAAVPDTATAPGGAQLRIDKLTSASGDVSFQIFVGGTTDFNPLPTDDGFDMTSGIAEAADLPSGALRGVKEAMRQAGITADTPITMTGYSLGGAIAAHLAASGDYNVSAVVTVGAPAGNVQLPADVHAVILENIEDFVPALGGPQSNTEALIVRHRAFESPDDIPAGLAVPGHRMTYYSDAAAELDDSENRRAVEARHRLDAFSAGAESRVSTYYRVDRPG